MKWAENGGGQKFITLWRHRLKLCISKLFLKNTVPKLTSAITQNFQSWKANRKKQYTIKYQQVHTFDS